MQRMRILLSSLGRIAAGSNSHRMKGSPSAPGCNLSSRLGLLIAVLLFSAPTQAAGIAVTADAAASGSFGAEVTVGSLCPWDESVTLDGPPYSINGSFTACGYLDVQDVTFSGLGNQLTAGVSVTFAQASPWPKARSWRFLSHHCSARSPS